MSWSIFIICVGACFGALSRWGLANALNALTPTLPLGTLVVNIGGGFIIGIAVSTFGHNPNISNEWKLLIITGFLGSLTTFSTFSAEVVSHIQSGRMTLAIASILAHVFGSLAATLFGIFLVNFARSTVQ